MRVKEESEKAGLKLNIQETKTMASSLITSWQIVVTVYEAILAKFFNIYVSLVFRNVCICMGEIWKGFSLEWEDGYFW